MGSVVVMYVCVVNGWTGIGVVGAGVCTGMFMNLHIYTLHPHSDYKHTVTHLSRVLFLCLVQFVNDKAIFSSVLHLCHQLCTGTTAEVS